jgi:hypothetical protein
MADMTNQLNGHYSEKERACSGVAEGSLSVLDQAAKEFRSPGRPDLILVAHKVP